MAYPNLAAEMARHGLSQQQIAQGISRNAETVSRWMTGKNPMPTDKAMEIRDRFFPGVSVDYLCDPEPYTPKPQGAA